MYTALSGANSRRCLRVEHCSKRQPSATAVDVGLRSLDLHGNKLTRIDGLQTLHSLRELVLDHNILKFLDPGCFANVHRLRRLHLGHNGLRSLAHLSNLTRLQFLHLGSNRITEVTELDRLTNLVSLTEIWLVDNLVAKKQWYRALLLSKCRHLKVSNTNVRETVKIFEAQQHHHLLQSHA